MNTCSSLAHLRSGSPRGQGPLAPRARHQRQLPEHPTLAATPAACSHVPCFIFFSNWPLRRRRGRTLPPPASRTRGWTPAGPARGLLRAQTRPGTGAVRPGYVTKERPRPSTSGCSSLTPRHFPLLYSFSGRDRNDPNGGEF